jgi:hypothetical protein
MTDSVERLAPAILLLLIALVLLRAGVGLVRLLRRRHSLREFAAAHGWAFHSVLRSNARPPYTRLSELRRTVLLWNVVEGHWNGHAAAAFERQRRRGVMFTGVLVTVGGRMRSLRADWAQYGTRDRVPISSVPARRSGLLAAPRSSSRPTTTFSTSPRGTRATGRRSENCSMSQPRLPRR